MGHDSTAARKRSPTLSFVAEAQERLGALPVQVTMREAWLEHAGVVPGARVLEVGCGTGVLTRDLARRVGPFGRVTAIDPSESLLRVCARLADEAGLASRVLLRLGDAGALDLPPNSFDNAASTFVFQHLTDPRAALKEIRRVLRPGATIAIFEHDIEAMSVDHPDRALTRIILQNAIERTVLCSDAARRLPGLCAELQLEEVEVLTFLQAERLDGYLYQLLLRFADLAVAQGRVRPENVQRWTDILAEKANDGTFFASLPHYAILARKPGLHRTRPENSEP
jgi:ubiquinone/menaquinone biosynthesis C-methylase UbiE